MCRKVSNVYSEMQRSPIDSTSGLAKSISSCSPSAESEQDGKMADLSFNLPVDLRTAARKTQARKHFRPTQNLTADGFDNWLRKTVAQHIAITAEASTHAGPCPM